MILWIWIIACFLFAALVFIYIQKNNYQHQSLIIIPVMVICLPIVLLAIVFILPFLGIIITASALITKKPIRIRYNKFMNYFEINDEKEEN